MHRHLLHTMTMPEPQCRNHTYRVKITVKPPVNRQMASQEQTDNEDSMTLVDKPFLTTDDAASLFSSLYGMEKPASIKQLDGYDSQNFHVKMKDPQMNSINCIEDNCTDPIYVLKVMSTEESKLVDCLQAIHSIQRYLNQHGYVCAAPLNNIYGEDMRLKKFTREQPKDNQQQQGKQEYGLFMVRAYPFIPGTTFDNAMPANSTQLFFESGKNLASFHHILQRYPENTDCLKKRCDTFQWSLNQLGKLMDVLDAAMNGNTKRRQLVTDIMKAFETKVMAKRDQLRTGIIHGDFNHTNLLLSPTSPEPHSTPGTQTTYKISGVIDFDDCQHTCLIFDIAISMAYLSLAKAAGDQPLNASAAFLAGYQSVSPLTPAELEVLHICQAARYIQSLVYGLYTYKLQPGNEYLLETQVGWPILEQLWKMEVVEIHKMWQDVATICVDFEKQGDNKVT